MQCLPRYAVDSLRKIQFFVRLIRIVAPISIEISLLFSDDSMWSNSSFYCKLIHVAQIANWKHPLDLGNANQRCSSQQVYDSKSTFCICHNLLSLPHSQANAAA